LGCSPGAARFTSTFQKRILVLSYQVRDALQAVRDPMVNIPRSDVESGNRIEAEQQVYRERWQVVTDRWGDLNVVCLEAVAIRGQGARAPIDGLDKLTREMRGQIWMFFWLKGAYAESAFVDRSPERVRENEKFIYRTSADDDFSKALDAAIAGTELFYRPRLGLKFFG
jgi:hypothetical protein